MDFHIFGRYILEYREYQLTKGGNDMKLDEDIHNYYEHLVIEQIEAMGFYQNKTTDFIADLTCLVLNQLPPRYIRYEVDMAFFLPISERTQMEMNVSHSITISVEYLEAHPKKEIFE